VPRSINAKVEKSQKTLDIDSDIVQKSRLIAQADVQRLFSRGGFGLWHWIFAQTAFALENSNMSEKSKRGACGFPSSRS
jgi:hypothetical protein